MMLRFFTYPLRKLSGWLHCERNTKARKVTECVLGVVVCCGASLAAVSYPEGCIIPHCVYDAIAYIIHGFGSAPLISAILRE